MMPTIQDSYPIIDGFLLSTSLKCNLTFQSMVLAQYEDLRRAGAYRSRTWVVPPDPSSVVIQARSAFDYQVDMPPGSAIWGYSIIVSQAVLTAGGSFSVQVTDTCNDVALFTEVINAGYAAPYNAQRFLSKLHVISNPGLLNVQICSTYKLDSAPGDVQLILWGGEPITL